MKIKIKQDVAKAITLPKLQPYGIDKMDLDYDSIIINLAESPMDKVKTLQVLLNEVPDKKNTALARRDIETWIDICENKMPKIRKLEHFKSALIKYFLPVEGHRFFVKHHLDNSSWLCHRIVGIFYHQGSAYRPATVEIKTVYDSLRERDHTSTEFQFEEVRGKTIPEILAQKGIYIETKQLRQNYLEEIKKFMEIYPQIGKQFIASGVGSNQIRDDRDDEDQYIHRWDTRKFEFIENKVVIDVFKEDDGKQDKEKQEDLGELFWRKPFSKEDDYDDEIDLKAEQDHEEIIEVPIHPFLTIFDLQRHMRLSIHVNYLTPYVYDKNLSEKLVLSEENKNLISLLIKHKEGGFKDIVQNKTGGAVILLTGPAGVGKTLTAEVFAESKEKPLYNVQASQLGVTPEKFEKALMRVLMRTSRWNAVLLIDESDVYIQQRGNNIKQNAIVGVILRVLEYHSSILFMTTNRPDVVDDAISSRCIARIDYKYPTKEQQILIWNILSETSKIPLSQKVINDFVEKHGIYSGRDIKNLLKLSNLKAKGEGKEIDVETIEFVTQFNPTKENVK